MPALLFLPPAGEPSNAGTVPLVVVQVCIGPGFAFRYQKSKSAVGPSPGRVPSRIVSAFTRVDELQGVVQAPLVPILQPSPTWAWLILFAAVPTLPLPPNWMCWPT